MADSLDKVIDTAKKLRKLAKKVNDPDIQSLVADLNLSLADLKLELVERLQEEMRAREQQEAATATTTGSGASSPSTMGATKTFTSTFATGPRNQG